MLEYLKLCVLFTFRALTAKPIDHVDAHSTISAGIGVTLVDVSLAMDALEARQTLTMVPVDTVNASGAITTRVGNTFIDVDLAIRTHGAGSTAALITVD
jgi:ketopantoate hydroxymethyltransferase